ncbi:MAG: T9SS type A sorting domain-containing protein [Bacteroidales bacterium]|nr:T9SS type A sorting domain-containing protein [Bacteroidales bacterium]
MNSKLLLFACLICLSIDIQAQDTIHVPADYPTIQAGIDEAMDGDVVLVEQGTYFENINFYGKAITVASHFIMEGDTNYINNTIIDGSQPANPNYASVVSFKTGEDTTSVLCGFTIQNGTGTHINWPARIGGGIFCIYSGASIIHNRIINNQVSNDNIVHGGGIGAYGSASSPCIIIRSNTIENNYGVSTTPYPGGGCGAGVSVWGIDCIVENNRILSNNLDGRPYGAGALINYCRGIVKNNVISDNTGNIMVEKGKGAGLYLENCQSGTVISGNIFSNNNLYNISGNSNGGGGIAILNLNNVYYNDILIEGNRVWENSAMYGGGIYVRSAYNLLLTNNVVQNNEVSNSGGGIYFTYYGKGENAGMGSLTTSNQKGNSTTVTIPVLVNNTITGNSSGSYGAGISTNMASDYLLFNNIIYDNAGYEGTEMYLASGCNAYLFNNNINTDEIIGAGSWQGNDNLNVDPCFDQDGYHLLLGSECVNEGVESVEINGNEYDAPDHDIDHEPRPFDNYVDIGADEVVITDIAELSRQLDNFSLNNYPNPFTQNTTITFTMQSEGIIRIILFDLAGKKFQVVLNEYLPSGYHEIELEGTKLIVGTYICILETDNTIVTKKIIKLD